MLKFKKNRELNTTEIEVGQASPHGMFQGNGKEKENKCDVGKRWTAAERARSPRGGGGDRVRAQHTASDSAPARGRSPHRP